jgi:hypothetical protein
MDATWMMAFKLQLLPPRVPFGYTLFTVPDFE